MGIDTEMYEDLQMIIVLTFLDILSNEHWMLQRKGDKHVIRWDSVDVDFGLHCYFEARLAQVFEFE